MVGTYTVPDDATDFLFDESRYRTTPPADTVCQARRRPARRR